MRARHVISLLGVASILVGCPGPEDDDTRADAGADITAAVRGGLGW